MPWQWCTIKGHQRLDIWYTQSPAKTSCFTLQTRHENIQGASAHDQWWVAFSSAWSCPVSSLDHLRSVFETSDVSWMFLGLVAKITSWKNYRGKVVESCGKVIMVISGHCGQCLQVLKTSLWFEISQPPATARVGPSSYGIWTVPGALKTSVSCRQMVKDPKPEEGHLSVKRCASNASRLRHILRYADTPLLKLVYQKRPSICFCRLKCQAAKVRAHLTVLKSFMLNNSDLVHQKQMLPN